MSTESTSATVVVDGDALPLMLALRNHSSLSYEELKQLAAQKYESDTLFDHAIKYIQDNRWAITTHAQITLTSEGLDWLDKRGSELTVEEETNESHDRLKNPYDVAKLKMETKYLSVFQALRKVEKNEIKLNPDFQRAFVWDNTRQSRLIESILIRIPLPAFYIDATDQISWNVVDGLQRLSTLVRYCRKQEFKLCNLQFLADLEGLRFDELPQQYKVLIEDDTQLLFYNLMPGTPVPAKYTIFSRVNTGGMQLTPQEIRHALSQGKSTVMLARLARSETFRSVSDGVVESLRMSDRELILRSLAFMHLGVEAYKKFGELDKFLLSAMEEFNSLDDIHIAQLEEKFLQALLKVRLIFGKYSFRKFAEIGGRRSPFNKALFEIWTVNVVRYDAEVLEDKKNEIIERFIKLLPPWEPFSKSISSSTGNYQAVSTRFSAIENLLEEIVNA